jgi:hypothetical protein
MHTWIVDSNKKGLTAPARLHNGRRLSWRISKGCLRWPVVKIRKSLYNLLRMMALGVNGKYPPPDMTLNSLFASLQPVGQEFRNDDRSGSLQLGALSHKHGKSRSPLPDFVRCLVEEEPNLYILEVPIVFVFRRGSHKNIYRYFDPIAFPNLAVSSEVLLSKEIVNFDNFSTDKLKKLTSFSTNCSIAVNINSSGFLYLIDQFFEHLCGKNLDVLRVFHENKVHKKGTILLDLTLDIL